jgi:hypothetical protein
MQVARVFRKSTDWQGTFTHKSAMCIYDHIMKWSMGYRKYKDIICMEQIGESAE